MRRIDTLFVHSVAVPEGVWPPDAWLDAQHAAQGHVRERKFLLPPWQHNPQLPHIGYHLVIAPNGAPFGGRHQAETSRVLGEPVHALHVALIGDGAGDNPFTGEQLQILARHILTLDRYYPGIRVRAASEIQPDAGPGFDLALWQPAALRAAAAQEAANA